MAKAVFHRRFDATDTKKGISIRIQPSSEAQEFPAWVIDKAVKAGVATREERKAPAKRPAKAAAASKKDS